MAYFTSLQNFVDTITTHLTKPIRGVNGSPGVSSIDVLEALKDTGKYTDDMRVVAQSALATFNAVYNPALNAASQAAASAAAAAAMVQGSATTRPSIPLSLLLDFANSEVLDPRITYSRADANKSYFDQKGVLRMAKANEWPREFDPATGRCLGRSVWEGRTNSVPRSQEFDNVAWMKSNATITANTLTAPDGTLSGDTITENAVNAAHYVTYGASYVTGQSLTLSCFMKAGTRTVGYLSMYNGTTTINAYFDLVAGTVLSANSSLVATIRNVGNGWFRVTSTYLSTVTASANFSIGLSITSSQVYTGDGASTLHIWGAQLEIGASASPYIPTTTVAVTRNADLPYMDGISDWYRADEGTLFVAALVPVSSGQVRRIAALTDGTTNNSIQLSVHSTSTPYMEVRDASSIQASNTFGGAMAVGDTVRIALGYRKDDFYAYSNGAALTDTTGTVPASVNRLDIGFIAGVGYYNAPVACIAYWAKRLANTEIQALTTSGLLAGKNSNQLPTVGDLGSAAFVQLRALLAMRNRQEFQVEGSGLSRTVTIRRPYDFQFALVDAMGATVTASPSTTAASTRDTNYSLTFNAPVGTLLTYSITPIY